MPILLDRTPDAPHLHVQVAAILKKRIHNGTWSSGSSIPSEKELCAEFDVARGTVRQALASLEAEGYLSREQGRGTFVQWREFSANRSRSQRLAFVVPYVRDSSVPTILVGFQQVAEQANYSVIFNHVNNDLQQQERVVLKLIDENVAGIALYPINSETLPIIENLYNARFPLVLIDRYVRTFSTDYVMTDHFGGAIRGTHYLFNLGHTRVGFVTWLSPAVSMEHRFLGYSQAVAERGLRLSDRLICRVEGYPMIDRTPLNEYLSGPDRPTAVFAANDQIAIAVYRAATSLGLSIPDDLSVLGFDDLDVSAHLDPPLTTIAQPFMQIGRTAAELLLRRISGERGNLEQLALQAAFSLRESCRALISEESTAPAI
ncbi:MAG: GntR family transcriptional regulator [Anaerolineae bacterium]|nr:GntR family transcriptional regulator [Anaerolineae bacterium]NUQ03072.1 GntR family transcriptional regulator [Anaerolineae bacterium]